MSTPSTPSFRVTFPPSEQPAHGLFRRYPLPRVRLGYAEDAQRFGQMLIVLGFGIAIAGVAAYCTICLLGGLGDAAHLGATPLTRWSLGVTGLGVFLWFVGAYHYFMGTLMADEEMPEADGGAER